MRRGVMDHGAPEETDEGLGGSQALPQAATGRRGGRNRLAVAKARAKAAAPRRPQETEPQRYGEAGQPGTRRWQPGAAQ